jgi:hypothetical protein
VDEKWLATLGPGSLLDTRDQKNQPFNSTVLEVRSKSGTKEVRALGVCVCEEEGSGAGMVLGAAGAWLRVGRGVILLGLPAFDFRASCGCGDGLGDLDMGCGVADVCLRREATCI